MIINSGLLRRLRICSKRARGDLDFDGLVVDSQAVGGPIASLAKHRKTASGSDFSTYEIGHALDTSPAFASFPAIATSSPASPKLHASTSLLTPDNSDQSTYEPPTSHSSEPGSKFPHHSFNRTTTPSPPEPVANLADLLDFTALISDLDIDTRFGLISHELLHNYRVEIRTANATEQLELLELEFYLYKSDGHEDPFTHASHEQSQAGRW